MTNEEIISKANHIINDYLFGSPRDLTREARFEDDLGADSLDLLEIAMAFEEEFGIEISETESDEIETVGQAHDLLIAKIAAK